MGLVTKRKCRRGPKKEILLLAHQLCALERGSEPYSATALSVGKISTIIAISLAVVWREGAPGTKGPMWPGRGFSVQPYPKLVDILPALCHTTRAREGIGAAPMSEPGDLVDELNIERVPSTTPSIVPLRPVPTAATYERDLTEADLVALQVLPRGPQPARALQRIRSSHHALARCIAMGLNPTKAALVTGYSPGRISQLANDPTFKQLVAEYSQDAKDVVADYTARMRGLGLDAMEEVHERLQEDPSQFSIPILLDIVTQMADRTGHGTGSSVTHNFNMPTIDRPPRENYEQFKERRMRELTLVPTKGEDHARKA